MWAATSANFHAVPKHVRLLQPPIFPGIRVATISAPNLAALARSFSHSTPTRFQLLRIHIRQLALRRGLHDTFLACSTPQFLHTLDMFPSYQGRFRVSACILQRHACQQQRKNFTCVAGAAFVNFPSVQTRPWPRHSHADFLTFPKDQGSRYQSTTVITSPAAACMEEHDAVPSRATPNVKKIIGELPSVLHFRAALAI
ncbi:hypothetical protein EDB89DRAFT_2203424 [Lactarius sanguifluus]|nr:hypothetical protein EDB89DRAFT_2203424 [Lactarius sanguifluus]